MNRYLIRTDKDERKTLIVRMGNPLERVGLIYTDFLLRQGNRDITREDIVNPETSKPIGQVRLYRKDNLIVVRFDGKDIAILDRNGTYNEDGEEVPFRRYDARNLTSEKYQRLREMGLDHAYSLGQKSQLSHIFCFEKDNSLASLVFSRDGNEGTQTALTGVALSLARRIENQDYVYEFLK